jgi:TRAP-type mannitol/chloroaromatic compound transport system permease small subunit
VEKIAVTEQPFRRLRKLLRVVDSASEWCGRVFAFLIIAMFAIIILGVITRYFFNNPLSWVYELALYIFFAQMMMGGGYAVLHGLHVRMDIVYSRFNSRNKAIIDCFTYLIFFFVVGMVLWVGSKMAYKSIVDLERASTAWRPYLWPVKSIIPVSAFFLLLQGLADFVRSAVHAVKGVELRSELRGVETR